MPKIEYKSIKFQQKSLELINLVNQVVEEYQAQGYELTLRQAYYQLVARGYIPNNERSYKNIGNLINDGRLAGLIDWHSITDRTRNLRRQHIQPMKQRAVISKCLMNLNVVSCGGAACQTAERKSSRQYQTLMLKYFSSVRVSG